MVPEPRGVYALQFFFLATALLAAAGGVSLVLLQIWPAGPSAPPNQFSAAFGFNTGLLLAGSWSMHRAVVNVRLERQRQFRRRLKLALAIGTLFVAAQTFALTCLIRQQPSDEAETGAEAFVAVFATLHGMHFVMAMLFLCFVTVQALADRYDHEYYWGVWFCAWFWHILGIVWLAILFVMMIAKVYG